MREDGSTVVLADGWKQTDQQERDLDRVGRVGRLERSRRDRECRDARRLSRGAIAPAGAHADAVADHARPRADSHVSRRSVLADHGSEPRCDHRDATPAPAGTASSAAAPSEGAEAARTPAAAVVAPTDRESSAVVASRTEDRTGAVVGLALGAAAALGGLALYVRRARRGA